MKDIIDKLKEFRDLQKSTDIFGKAENIYHGRQVVYYGDNPGLFKICECNGDKNHKHGDFISCAYNLDINTVIEKLESLTNLVKGFSEHDRQMDT